MVSMNPSGSRTGHDLPGLPAALYYLEREFGHKVPRCPFCGSHEMHDDSVNAAKMCHGCGKALAIESIEWVPEDIRAAKYERVGGCTVEVPL